MELREIAAHGGERFVQITTLGSSDRASHEKSSQTIQLDAEAADALVRFIQNTFAQSAT